MMDQTATPTRDTPRRAWWAGRIDVAEIIDAGAIAAAPQWPAPPIVGGILGGPAQRRRDRLPSPPRRDRPADLEASATGLELYGPRRAVPMPHQLIGPAARTPADTAGTKLTYRPLDARGALVRSVRVHLPAASAGLVCEVQLVRAGATLPLYASAAGAALTVDAPIALQPGDELRVAVTTAGAAGTELVAHMAVEELT